MKMIEFMKLRNLMKFDEIYELMKIIEFMKFMNLMISDEI